MTQKDTHHPLIRCPMPFVTFEGIEGSGKSTQAQRLAARLGPDTVFTQEPGGTGIGRAIRGLLLDQGHNAMAPEAEVLLFFADRAQHVAELVRPALLAGRSVVSDRYTDSSLAYQGYGRGIDRALILAVARLATGGLQPDLTFLLDVPVDVGLARAGRRGPQDRLEAEVREFHDRVRAGYLEMAGAEPARWVRVDGEGPAEEVARRVAAAAEARGLVGRHAVP
jgi:dTMP kinase